MAVNVKLGVDLDAFTSGIREGQNVLKGLKAEMKATESEFKATGNAEQMLANKTKTLNSQIAAQRYVIDNANAALKAMTDAGIKPTDAAYQKMYATLMNATAGMNNAQAELNALSGSAQGAAASADQLSTSVQNIGKKISLDQVISGIGRITDGLERAAQKAIRFGQELWDAIMESASWADNTATMADNYNIPLERYLQMQRLVGSGMDTTVENMLSAQDKMTKGIGKGSKEIMGYLEDLHVGMREGILEDWTSWKQKDPEKLFWEVGQALFNMSDAYDKEAAAQALFGKSWKELSSLFREYKSLEEYNKALEEMTVNDEETVRDLAALNDAVGNLEQSWDVLKNQVLGSLAPALEKGANAISGLLDSLTEYLKTEEGQQLLDSLGSAIDSLFEDLGKIDPQDVVNNFTSVFNGLVGSLQWIVNNKDTLVGALEAIVAGWAGLKITGSLLTIIQFINGLKDLGGGGNNQNGQTTGTTGTTGNTGNVMFDSKLGQAAATSMVLGTTWGLIENGNIFNDSSLSDEDQIRNWVSEQVKDGFIDAGKSDELTEKNLKMFEMLKEYGQDADIPVSVVPEASDGAAASIAEQVGPVALPVTLYFAGGGAGIGGGGGGMVDFYSAFLTPRGFANGIHSVPYDGMLARLHKGERVMPAREVQSRSYNSNLYVESMYMNNGTDAAGLASAMAAAQQRQMSGFGS